jgi:hypothetical protein
MWCGEPPGTRTLNPLIKSQVSLRNVPQTRTVPGLARSLAVAKSPLGQLFNSTAALCQVSWSCGKREPLTSATRAPEIAETSTMPCIRHHRNCCCRINRCLGANSTGIHQNAQLLSQWGPPRAGNAGKLRRHRSRNESEYRVNSSKWHLKACVFIQRAPDGVCALRALIA